MWFCSLSGAAAVCCCGVLLHVNALHCELQPYEWSLLLAAAGRLLSQTLPSQLLMVLVMVALQPLLPTRHCMAACRAVPVSLHSNPSGRLWCCRYGIKLRVLLH
jgi:hypothetical protein